MQNQLASLQPNGHGYTFREVLLIGWWRPTRCKNESFQRSELWSCTYYLHLYICFAPQHHNCSSCFPGRYSEGESRYNLQNPKLKAAVKVIWWFVSRPCNLTNCLHCIPYKLTQEYVKISAKHGISPAILAVGMSTHHFCNIWSCFPLLLLSYPCLSILLSAFVLRHPLVSSAVFGATEISQLTEVLQATRIHLSEEIVSEINEVHARYPNPCP